MVNDRQRRRFERVSRIRAFMTEHAPDFPETGKAGQAAARLNTVLAELESLNTSRVTNKGERQQASIGRREARETLRAHLTTLRDTAETIALDHPELKGVFKWSRASVSDQTLLATARAFAATAAPFRPRFAEYDLPPDFFVKLTASIEEFDRHIARQTATVGSGVAATASIEDALKRAEAEAERLDTSVRNKYRDDTARMAFWESASRLERAPRAAETTDPAKPPAPE
ncbi:MAG TPA: hypothetical protein VFS10_19375 [Pyrinomonadaceae bacterium]|nr:hypothetical protein [Pyrinomonadaceae bacterium]